MTAVHHKHVFVTCLLS